jgi:hypothetical protein
MANFHHKSIKKFHLSGSINDESMIPRLKNEYIRLLVSEMRLSGYSPKIDIDPDFTIEYNEEKEIFKFELSVYGIYVGKRQSACIQGIDGSTAIYIQKNKSKESLLEQESRFNQK